MRVLVVSTNRERSPQTLIPLGACCVASAAAAAGHQARLLDLCFSRRPASDVESEVRRLQPEVIGLSIRNLDNCDATAPHGYLPEVRQIIDAARQGCDAPIVLGGPAVGEAPRDVARHLGCRWAVGGEGEHAFPALLDALAAGRDPARVPGVTDAESEAGTPATPQSAADLAPLPDPSPERWVDLHRYARCDTAFPIQAKRGCAFRCSYCCYPLLEGSAWRLRAPEWVAEQAAAAAQSGLRGIEFVDSVFGLPAVHAIACCEAIARARSRRHALSLTTLELNPLACTPPVIEAMGTAGFTAVGVTVESGSETMLESLGKGFGVDDAHHAAENLRRLPAKKLWIFMLGGPGETEGTVSETGRFIDQLPVGDLVLVTHGLRVLPRTTLAARLVAEGALASDDPLVEPTFYHSPRISPDRAREILARGAFPRANRITLTDCSHPLAPLVQRIAASMGLRPPFWRGLPAINRARRVLGL